MSFLENTDSSVILNRFSQDMSLIDMALPQASFAFFLGWYSQIFYATSSNNRSAMAMSLMNLSLICVGSSYMASTVPFTLSALYCIQKFYLRTSRQIRLLDLEAKSPLYRQFTETLEGVISIRAFRWQKNFNRAILGQLDYSQKPYYLLFCIQRWLNLVLDLTVAAMAIIVVALALCVPTSRAAAANIGVALVSVLEFNSNLQTLIRSWTEAEMSLGSVSRTKAFGEDTPNEGPDGDSLDSDVGETWPVGAVEASNLTVIYR
jgi:ABC-type multidrug transport system fused ATPase/permease subunit